MSKKLNDLIRIEDAIKVLCRKTCHPGVLCPDSYCVEMWDEFKDVERVDAVPVAHGKWIQFPTLMAYKCSECGRVIQTTDGQRNVSKHYPFCHCGAKMDGKDGDNGKNP